MSCAVRPVPEMAQLAVGFVFAALLWVVSTPYTGIYHDAIVYALLVARWLDPGAFVQELFFQFGAQDQFSAFTPLYGALVRVLGLADAARLIVGLGGMLWLIGCLSLGRVMLRRTWLVVLALLYCAQLKWSFSPNSATFTFNENFATARSLALPLGVLAVAALLARRQMLFWALALASTAFHPLHGIWTIVLYLAMGLRDSRLVVLIAGGAILVIVGAATGTPPLDIMVPDWADTVRASSTDVFVGGWNEFRLGDVLLTVGVLWLGAVWGSEANRRIFGRLALITVLAVLLSQLCSYFFPIRLIMQAQPWRVLWLGELLAIYAVCDLLGMAIKSGKPHTIAAFLAMIVGWGADWIRPFLPYGFLLTHYWPVLSRVSALTLHTLENRFVAAVSVSLIVSLLLPLYWLSLGIAGNAVATSIWPEYPELRGFILGGGEGVALIVVALLLRYRISMAIVFLTLLTLLTLGASRWDHRSSAKKTVEARYLAVDGRKPIGQIPWEKGDVLAWHTRSMEAWTTFDAGFYATTRQAIGIVFSHERTVEIRRRLRRLAVAQMLDSEQDAIDEERRLAEFESQLVAQGHDPRDLHKYGLGELAPGGVAYLCRDPVLDWVVSPHRTVAGQTGVPFNPGELMGGRQFVHDCRKLRT